MTKCLSCDPGPPLLQGVLTWHIIAQLVVQLIAPAFACLHLQESGFVLSCVESVPHPGQALRVESATQTDMPAAASVCRPVVT